MPADLETVLSSVHEAGYPAITRTEGFREASGRVPIPEAHCRDPPEGWRRLLPRVHCGANPDLVPGDLRAAVEEHGWTVQPMGRDDRTVLVVVSEDGV